MLIDNPAETITTIEAQEASPVTAPSKIPSKKGFMKAEYTLTLHSWEARGLFFGKWEHGKFGLLQYAKTVYFLTQAYYKDDPYAEYFLIETDTRLFEIQQTLKAIEAELTQALAKFRGFDITIYAADMPLVRPIQFLSPLGFMGAALLVDLDHIIRTALTLKQLGCYLTQEQYNPSAIHQTMLTLFEFPSRWQKTQVTRQDVLENSERAQMAKAKMGELPDAVLQKKIPLPYLKSMQKMSSK